MQLFRKQIIFYRLQVCRRWVCINQFANVPAAGSYAYIRRTSDRLCKEHGLSVVTSQLYRCRKVERPRT